MPPMKFKYILWSLLLLALLALTLPYAFEVVCIILHPKGSVTILRQLALYQWVAVGMVAYHVVHKFVKNNIKWMEVFSHELSHTIVAMFLFRRIHSFQAEEREGVITTSGTEFSRMALLSLAPYCLPIFTLFLLALRGLISDGGFWIFDILVGITLMFHLYCFHSQTGKHQTDINRFPLFYSYLFIWVVRVLVFCIIWVSFFPQENNLFYSTWRLMKGIWSNLMSLF